MNKRYLKKILYVAAPLFLLLPFSLSKQVTHYFQSVVLHPNKMGITTLSLHDKERNRPVITEVWYPVHKASPSQAATGFWLRCDEARDAPISDQKTTYPLIVFSHGNGGDRFNISWLAEILAANGYIVAAMDHYGNTWNNKIPEAYVKPWERPKDISFVITTLLTNSPFKDKIDPSRIGFAGYSLGGATGIWIAGGTAGDTSSEEIAEICVQELKGIVPSEVVRQVNFDEARCYFGDDRVRAFVLMAPALGWLFDEKSLQTVQSPVFIFGAENDDVAPIATNASLFAKKMAQAKLKIIPGNANHYVFLNCASRMGKRLLEPRYHEDPANIERRKVHEEIGKSAVAFFGTHLK